MMDVSFSTRDASTDVGYGQSLVIFVDAIEMTVVGISGDIWNSFFKSKS
jgi:hypothetical protein